jgi:hypothetical protein
MTPILLILETTLKVVAITMTAVAAALFIVVAAEILGDGGEND